MDFYQIVILVAICALVLIMIWFAYTIRNGSKTATFPPVSNVCPDNWTQGNIGNVVTCSANSSIANQGNGVASSSVNTVSSLYNYTAASGSTLANYIMYPNADEWANTGISALCAKKKWTDQYQIQWNGVSNTNAC